MIDIAIVGGGPVATLLAAELARHGTETVRWETRSESGAGARAVGIHATALAAMEASGATDRLLTDAVRVRIGEARRAGRSLGELHFDRLHRRHPFVATLPQSATEAALAATAVHWGATPVQYDAGVTALVPRADAVDVHVGDDVVTARVVVVAGGLRARALLDQPVRGRQYPDRYLMTDCADLGHDGERAVVYLDRAGVLESFPLPGGRRRFVAWMPPRGDGRTDAERLREAVAERTGSTTAALSVESASAFGVARSRLGSMRRGRVLAIGDTAHEVSPIGGQGMNLGLIDAVTLAPLLARAVRDGSGPAGLPRWERDRLRAADRAARIGAINTVLGRPSRAGGAVAVAIALATPAERLLAHAYAMGFDPAARQIS